MGLLSSLGSFLPGGSQQYGVGGPFFWGYVAFSTTMHCFEQYLELRQLRKNREKVMPEDVKLLNVEETKFQDSQAYQADTRGWGMKKSWIKFFHEKLSLVLITPAVWSFANHVCEGHEYKATLLWLFICQWLDKPLDIPLSLWDNFVVEERHGFNKMSIGLFFTDMIKSELLSYVFAGPIIPGLIWLVRWGGRSFYLYVWAFMQALLFIFMWLYPNLIQPLFNTYEELHDKELLGKINDLAASEQFPLKELYQVDGSKRSGHSNAYFYGFGKNKRIVIYDTLLTLSHDQVLAVLLHELGHWKFMHTLVNIGVASGHLFIVLWLYGVVMFSDLSKDIVRAFGYGDTDNVMIGLMTFMMLLQPVEQVVALLMTMKSRANEFQADSFAAQRGRSKDLGLGLLQINEENKGSFIPDPLYSWYHHSHPPVVERLRALGFFDKPAEEAKKDK